MNNTFLVTLPAAFTRERLTHAINYFIHDDDKYGGPGRHFKVAPASPLFADLLEACKESLEQEYNPFEPDNQRARYFRLKRLIARAEGLE